MQSIIEFLDSFWIRKSITTVSLTLSVNDFVKIQDGSSNVKNGVYTLFRLILSWGIHNNCQFDAFRESITTVNLTLGLSLKLRELSLKNVVFQRVGTKREIKMSISMPFSLSLSLSCGCVNVSSNALYPSSSKTLRALSSLGNRTKLFWMGISLKYQLWSVPLRKKTFTQ